MIRITTLCICLFCISFIHSQQVDAGNGHAIIVDKKGKVWTVGRNYFGQLGMKGIPNSTRTVHVKGLPKIKQISRGYDHCLAVDHRGNVWAWGRNNYGQISTRYPQDYFEPYKVKQLSDIIAVEGGHWHSVAIKKDGTVWAWGHNRYGELGNLTNEHSYVPTQVLKEDGSPLKDIVEIASVGYHTLALNSKGEVYSWGGNILGQLGHFDSNKPQRYAAKIESLSNIKQVAAGWHHSVAIDQSGHLYLWGSDPSTRYDGILGEHFDGIEIIENVPQLTSIACGSWHSLAIDKKGNVWGWGRNSFGIMGTGDTLGYTYPKKLPYFKNIRAIGGGCFQTLAVDREGTIWTSGANGNGQQGTGDYQNIHKPVELSLGEGRSSFSKFKSFVKNNLVWFLLLSILVNLVLLWSFYRRRAQALS